METLIKQKRENQKKTRKNKKIKKSNRFQKVFFATLGSQLRSVDAYAPMERNDFGYVMIAVSSC